MSDKCGYCLQQHDEESHCQCADCKCELHPHFIERYRDGDRRLAICPDCYNIRRSSDAAKTRGLTSSGVADVLVMVYGGGGDAGLPDPDVIEMRRIISMWTDEERQNVVDFACAVYAVASDNEGVDVPEKPACLVAMMNEMNCQFA